MHRFVPSIVLRDRVHSHDVSWSTAGLWGRRVLAWCGCLAVGGTFGCAASSVLEPCPETNEPQLAVAVEVEPEGASTRADAHRPSEADDGRSNAEISTASLQGRIAQFAPAKLEADLSGISDSERKTLELLIEAARYLDPIFERQAWAGNPTLVEALDGDHSERGRALREYRAIMRGPWDRQDGFLAFATDHPRPPGGGYYPEDMTKAEFEAFVAAHPERKTVMQSLFTMIVRDGNQLRAVPYSQAFVRWLLPAAKKLREAAATTNNRSLARFLRLRADAFANDDYYESDKAWMDLDSKIEITIGPYETYEDQLFGQKAAFEAFVTVSDDRASKALAGYKRLLPAMEANLPIPEKYRTRRGSESPIRVVDLVYTSGDARSSVQTIAFNLPNDERVRKEKGAKKVLLRNLIKTKFDRILRPIGERVLVSDQLEHLSADAFFNEILFHELSHSLGPAFVGRGADKVEVRVALGSSYSPLEEAKADAMGAYNVLYMIERGKLPRSLRPQLLVSYFAGLFRSVRFGVEQAHGRGAALQLNRLLEAGAVTLEGPEDDRRFRVDLERVQAEIREIVADICILQAEGNRAGVDDLLGSHGRMTPAIAAAVARLGDIPVDVRPIYPAAGEARAPDAFGG